MSARVHARWDAPKLPASPTLAQLVRAEASALIAALASPQSLVREVEAMGALLDEARRIEAHDPPRAEALRAQASRSCT